MRHRAAVVMLTAPMALFTLGLGTLQAKGPKSDAPAERHTLGATLGRAGGWLDIDGDSRAEVLVGAPGALLGDSVGGLFVYDLTTDGESRLLRVLRDGDNCGYSYAMLPDLDGRGRDGFAVGAVNGGERIPLSGAVSVYRKANLVRPVRLEGETALDRFGFSIARGDLNGDGAPDLVVGAPFHSPSPELYQKGAVYVFFGPSFANGKPAKITGTAENGVGFSVATGDVNGDGVDDLLLEGTGRVLGFYGARGTKAFAPDAESADLTLKSAATGFGRAMLVADLNADGCGEIVIGAYRAGGEAGEVLVVSGGALSGTVDLDAKTPAPWLLARFKGPAGSQFGAALGAVADLDGDRSPDLAVGAVHADSEQFPSTGRVWILRSSGLAGPEPFAGARVLDGAAPDMHFGSFLAADTAGDRLIVGAPSQDENRGGFYLFDLSRR